MNEISAFGGQDPVEITTCLYASYNGLCPYCHAPWHTGIYPPQIPVPSPVCKKQFSPLQKGLNCGVSDYLRRPSALMMAR